MKNDRISTPPGIDEQCGWSDSSRFAVSLAARRSSKMAFQKSWGARSVLCAPLAAKLPKNA
jgi:hypothetical protein